jgi:hypothetical protein
MGEKLLDIFRPEKPRMGLASEVMDIAKDPLTIGLLCAIRIMVISEDLANLVH